MVSPAYLESPWAVALTLANPGRTIMTHSSCEENCLMCPHIFPVRTLRGDDTTSESLHGRSCRKSADVGIEDICLSNGEEVSTDDTVMAEPDHCCGEGAPHWIAGLYFKHTATGGHDAAQYPESSSDNSPGHICVE